MKKAILASFIAMLFVLSMFSASLTITSGEKDEKIKISWKDQPITPGKGYLSRGAADHLLLSEVCVTPTNGEFVEIYNPTDSSYTLGLTGTAVSPEDTLISLIIEDIDNGTTETLDLGTFSGSVE